MNNSCSPREPFLDDRQVGWLLLGFGMASIVGAVVAFRNGRIDASYRRWGCWVNVILERDKAPIQFAIQVLLRVVAGFILIDRGLGKMFFS
jgi:hypothetical protein